SRTAPTGARIARSSCGSSRASADDDTSLYRGDKPQARVARAPRSRRRLGFHVLRRGERGSDHGVDRSGFDRDPYDRHAVAMAKKDAERARELVRERIRVAREAMAACDEQVDHELATLAQRGIVPSCSRGCTACCRQGIFTTRAEAEAIVEWL